MFFNYQIFIFYLYMKFLVNYHYGGTNSVQSEVNSFGSEFQLVKDGIIDHNFFEKKINFNGLKFKLLSINIAQMDQFRTMVQHNKIINYIRKEENLKRISKFPINDFLNDIANIVNEFKLTIEKEISSHGDISQMKSELKSIIIEDRSVKGAILKLIREKYSDKFSSDELDPELNLRWLKHKEKYYSEIGHDELDEKIKKETNTNEKLNLQNIKLAKQRFPNDYYIDISFSKESIESYYSRINKVLDFLTKRLSDGEMGLICLQELNPVFNDENTELRSELKSIFEEHKLTFKFPEEYIRHLTGTCSVTLTTENLSYFVSPYSEDLTFVETNYGRKLINNHELIKKIHQRKKLLQNFRYKLSYDGKDLDIYNLHTNMFSDNLAYDKLNEIIEYLKDKKFILVGDMNLLMNYRIIHRVTKLFRDNRIALDLIQTPEVDYENYTNPQNPTYDIFSAKGVDILY